MQTLKFESAWDRTIAPEDRTFIEKVFEEDIEVLKEGIHLSFLKQAINHRGHILVTVLIHNFNDATMHMNNKVIAYDHSGHVFMRGVFSLPFTISPHTTMPWTFIFTEKNITEKPLDFRISQMP